MLDNLGVPLEYILGIILIASGAVALRINRKNNRQNLTGWISVVFGAGMIIMRMYGG